MRYITLVIIPGDGASSVQVADDTTLAQFAANHGLNGRQLIVDGEGVPATQWGAVTLDGATEIFATGAVKGN
jgi:sulfur carrier protein ThiS